MVPSGDMKARLLAAVHEQPSPTRATRRRVELVIAALVTTAAAWQFFKEGGPHLGDRPLAFVVLTTAGWCVAIAALVFTLRSRPPLGPPSALLWVLALGSIAWGFAVGLVGNALYPITALHEPSHPGLICIELALAWSTLPITGWVFVRQESDPVHPVALGAAVGALAGCFSALLVNLTCRYADASHVAFGHIAPALFEVGLGALLGWLLLSMRARRSPWRVGAAIGAAVGGWAATLINIRIQKTCPTSFDPRELVWLVGGLAVGGLCGLAVVAILERRSKHA